MNVKSIFIILCALMTYVTFYGAERYHEPLACIQLDTVGSRVAVWSDRNMVNIYNNGVLDGPSVSFSMGSNNCKPYVDSILFFSDGSSSGSEVFFHSNGVIAIIRTKINPNTDFVGAQKEYDKGYVFPYQSYVYEFDDKGRLYCEGWEIIGEDTEIDSEKVGVWKYYNPDGLFEVVDFSKDEVDESKYSRH